MALALIWLHFASRASHNDNIPRWRMQSETTFPSLSIGLFMTKLLLRQ